MAKKRIQIGSAKDKGRRLQQWVCAQISELIGMPWGRDQPIESRPMGQAGTDVRLESGALRLFPFSVETKYQESWAVPGWIDHARRNQIEGTDWLLVARRNRFDPVVIMDAAAFFKLLGKHKCSEESTSKTSSPMRRRR